MSKPVIPVYPLDAFHQSGEETDFYCNTLKVHLRKHHFIYVPHKHDFYVCVLFTKGTGTHEIDFVKYRVQPRSVFFLKPGQMHNWKLSDDTDGYIFFHSRAFFDLCFNRLKIADFSFYGSGYGSPALYLKQACFNHSLMLFKELFQAYSHPAKLFQAENLGSIANLIYLDMAREFRASEKQGTVTTRYLEVFGEFEKLVDTRYKVLKSPAAYAHILNITGKHLNRVCQHCIHKTATAVITDRIILEAKRMLLQPGYILSDIADALGMFDRSYFNRLFKKKTGETPYRFSQKHR